MNHKQHYYHYKVCSIGEVMKTLETNFKEEKVKTM